MAEFCFYFIALSTCAFALLTVISRDVFHSAVWLAMTLLSISGVYFYLAAEFLGVVQILVYVGGIITLFVFAIKLTARIGDASFKQTNQQVAVSGAVCIIFLALLFKIVGQNPWVKGGSDLAGVDMASQAQALKNLGQELVTTYVLPFEFISLLLLAAMVGAIVIGKVKQ